MNSLHTLFLIFLIVLLISITVYVLRLGEGYAPAQNVETCGNLTVSQFEPIVPAPNPSPNLNPNPSPSDYISQAAKTILDQMTLSTFNNNVEQLLRLGNNELGDNVRRFINQHFQAPLPGARSNLWVIVKRYNDTTLPSLGKLNNIKENDVYTSPLSNPSSPAEVKFNRYIRHVALQLHKFSPYTGACDYIYSHNDLEDIYIGQSIQTKYLCNLYKSFKIADDNIASTNVPSSSNLTMNEPLTSHPVGSIYGYSTPQIPIVGIHAGKRSASFSTQTFITVNKKNIISSSYTKSFYFNINPNANTNAFLLSSKDNDTTSYHIINVKPSRLRTYSIIVRHNRTISMDELLTDQYIFVTGRWVHCVVTYDNPTKVMIVYLDGEEIGRKTVPESFSGGNVIDIARNFDGFLRSVRIWNKALSSTDVRNVYLIDKLT